jgi:hypothetical protein
LSAAEDPVPIVQSPPPAVPARALPAPEPTGPLPKGCASWQEAGSYAGQSVCICGPVADGNYAEGSKGRPTFLNVGARYPDPDRFTILIWGEHRGAFPAPPEQFYPGKQVCVTGTVRAYRGSMEVEAQKAGQIVVLP